MIIWRIPTSLRILRCVAFSILWMLWSCVPAVGWLKRSIAPAAIPFGSAQYFDSSLSQDEDTPTFNDTPQRDEHFTRGPTHHRWSMSCKQICKTFHVTHHKDVEKVQQLQESALLAKEVFGGPQNDINEMWSQREGEQHVMIWDKVPCEREPAHFQYRQTGRRAMWCDWPFNEPSKA